MQTQFIAESEPLHVQQKYTQELVMKEDAYYNITVELHSETDWTLKHHESALLQVELYANGSLVHVSNIVTYMGKKKHQYELHLGYFKKGSYTLILQNRSISVCEQAVIHLYDVKPVAPLLTDEQKLVYEHLPLIFGRNHFTNYDNCFSDTPMAMLYRYEQDEESIVIEYHIIFSHEDEGTPGKLLFAKWGRLTDIEWCYRVTIDRKMNAVIERVYQGPEHETRMFAGDYVRHSKRPVLQVRTTNGNSDHIIDSTYSFSLPPAIMWESNKEPREFYMKEYSHINAVMIKEAERQLLKSSDEHNRVLHPTNYIYCFFYINEKDEELALDLAYESEQGGKVIQSSYSYKEHIYGLGTFTVDELNFAIAIEANEQHIGKMCVRLLAGKYANINNITFYSLNEEGHFTEVANTKGMIELTVAKEERRLEEFLK